MRLGNIVRIKETGEIGIVVTRYFWGQICVLLFDDRSKSKWFNEADDTVDFMSENEAEFYHYLDNRKVE